MAFLILVSVILILLKVSRSLHIRWIWATAPVWGWLVLWIIAILYFGVVGLAALIFVYIFP